MLNKVVFRVDVGSDVGVGHFMRCVALGQELKKKYVTSFFLINNLPLPIKKKCEDEGFVAKSIIFENGGDKDARYLVNFCKEVGSKLVVIDGYRFGPNYLEIVRSAGIEILFIDDLGSNKFIPSDYILNQNITINNSDYKANEGKTQLLLGSKYILLRKEFLDFKLVKKDLSNAKNLLITLGGSDKENVSLFVLQSLDKDFFDLINVTVILGPMNANYQEINDKFGKMNNISIRQNVKNMAELISHSDIVITVPGVTIWEMLFFSIPTITITVSENQKNNATELNKKGAIISLGNYAEISHSDITESLKILCDSEKKRKELSIRASEVVD